DGFVSSIDAPLVVNYLNSQSGRGTGEGEGLTDGNNAPEGIADPPTLSVSVPVSEATLPAGQALVLMGQALDGSGPASLVQVNGQAVDVLDAAGNFFHQVQIAPGMNSFTVQASDAAGDTTTRTVTVEGTQLPVGAVDFAHL